MPIATAKLGNLRIGPRKARLVADLIRGKRVDQARNILTFAVKGAAEPIRKLLNSAVANAENAAAERRERIDTDALIVTRIVVNEGHKLYRVHTAPRGTPHRIRKRSSQVELTISGE